MVLLHGQPGTHLEMQRIEEHLGEGLRVLNVDRPGYGKTGGRALGFSDQADLLAAELRFRDAGPAVVMGFSFGGGLALTMALRHPELVAGLVLVSSIGGEGSVTFGDSLLAAPVVGRVTSGLTLFGFGQLLPRIAHLLPSESLRANVPHHPEILPLRAFEAFVAEQRLLVEDHRFLTEELGQIECSSIVIYGSHDLVVSPAAARDLGARVGAEVTELEGYGHLLERDAPEVVAAAIWRLVTETGAVG